MHCVLARRHSVSNIPLTRRVNILGYLHIDNLYKAQKILMHAECYALEKVHGTSAHLQWSKGLLTYFSGGEEHTRFVALFDHCALVKAFIDLGHDRITIYGEAYGGRQQRMALTYGSELRFIAFDVRIDGIWLDVPDMASLVAELGLEVVPWERTSTDLATLDQIRDRPSEVAMRRGCGADKIREGIVIRPIHEEVRGDSRLIVKHKGETFRETGAPRKVVDPKDLIVLQAAQAIADEWVTEMRLDHVLDKLVMPMRIEETKLVLDAMVADVYREASGEIVESRAATQAICRKTAQMFKRRLSERRV